MNRYEDIVRHFFYAEEQTAEANFNNQHVKPPYMEALLEKQEALVHEWPALLEDIAKLPGIIRLRDWSQVTMHVLKVLMTTDEKATNGLVLYLSFLGKQIGFYYIDSANPEDRPVLGYDRGNLSYWPLNRQQAQLSEELTALVKKHFDGFQLLAPAEAGQSVSDVQTFERFWKQIDLFQVIFDTQITGLF